MTLTHSQSTLIGTKAPDFTLPDTITEKPLSLQTLAAKQATVIMFICNHCPYVQHIEEELIKFVKKYQSKGIAFIAISANDIQQYPQDNPQEMQKRAASKGYTFSYLYDETQQVAKAYGAQCTPEFYVLNGEKTCIYHGCFDDSSPGRATPVTGKNLAAVLDATLSGNPIPEPQLPSMGCNIKWKK